LVKVIEKDLLVIGGGMAATSTAVEASKRGLDVLILSKGLLGRESCSVGSAFWSGYWSPSPGVEPPDNTEWKWRRALTGRGTGLNNQEIQKKIIFGGSDATSELEEMGLYFRRLDDGTPVYICPYGKTISQERAKELGLPRVQGGVLPMCLIAGRFGSFGTQAMHTMRAEVWRRNIDFLENCCAIRLLTKDGAVVGAIALNLTDGELIVAKAKGTVCCMGAHNWLVTYATGMRTQTGDNWSLPYRAGAELMDIEMQGWHHADVGSASGGKDWPECWFRLQFYPYSIPLSQDYPHFYNLKGERFMEDIEVAAPYEARASATAYQIFWGGESGDYRGGTIYSPNARFSLMHWDLDVAREVWTQYDYFDKLEYDPAERMYESGMSWHANSGGIRTNEKMEASLPGLYSAGNNAHSVGAMIGGYVSGKIAARSVAERARMIEMPELDWSQVEEEEKKMSGLLALAKKKEGLLPAQIKKRIRAVMWEGFHFVKNEEAMQKSLEGVKNIRKEIVLKMRLGTDTKVYNIDLMEAYDVQSMLDACEVYANMCLSRRESRGPYVRSDYPIPDPNEMVHTMAKLVNGKLHISKVPVEEPYANTYPLPDHFDPRVKPHGRWVRLPVETRFLSRAEMEELARKERERIDRERREGVIR